MIIHTICNDFDRERFENLKKSYDEAVANRKEKFDFEEQPVNVKFAKYLLEYLEENFK